MRSGSRCMFRRLGRASLKYNRGRTDNPKGCTAMRAFRFVSLATVLLILSGSGALLRAQSLADVAKKEEERRKSIPQPAKVYTNKDLTPAPAGSAALPPATKDTKDTPAAKDAKDPKDAKDAKDGKEADAKDKSATKDQKYWSEKMKALREQLDRDQTFADAIQNKINSLTTEFVNRDDPAQRTVIEQNRQKALAELARLNKAIIDEKKAIADFEEEARRAGVSPGWLR